MTTAKQMINGFGKAIIEHNAAIFSGAGLSSSSGYVNWQELLRPFADEIHLSIDKEHDYLAVAQYSVNESGGNRDQISRAILENFSKTPDENDAVKIIARLPIDTYWTTNYDKLLENALSLAGRKVDVKITEKNLSISKPGCDATVYKMHGDVDNPAEIVLTKDDYESYEHNRGLFSTALSGALVAKTFLFIGFSFEDPNLTGILGRIKSLLKENTRTHYCLFEKVSKKPSESDDSYEYRKCKQHLVVNDLQRYGIRAVLLDSYSQIPDVLKRIERRAKQNSLFISGSMFERNDTWSIGEALEFASQLSNSLSRKGYQITSGYGFNVGSAVITGVLNASIETPYCHLEDKLRLYPFPQPVPGIDPSPLLNEYRTRFIPQCGNAIFLFGNKNDDGNAVIADGMMKELKIALDNGLRVIPIASTGDTAKLIYDELYEHQDKYPYLSNFWGDLRDERNPSVLTDVISQICDKED